MTCYLPVAKLWHTLEQASALLPVLAWLLWDPRVEPAQAWVWLQPESPQFPTGSWPSSIAKTSCTDGSNRITTACHRRLVIGRKISMRSMGAGLTHRIPL